MTHAAAPADDATRPLGGIALCLSGGGYRAAAYHLGTLTLLDRVGLREHVTTLSTVSGGTFAGAVYALYQAEGKGFREYAEAMLTFMKSTDVVMLAIQSLQRDQIPGRTPSVIRRAAAIYDERLFKGARFGQVLDHEGHLREITFNATDMTWGLPFRFQKSRSTGALIGNQDQHITREAASRLRLADIAAASSCFPGVFEPIHYPDDFVDAAPLKDGGSWPLMDGGIFDNQGIEAALRADERVQDEIDLILVSDTDQSGTEIYTPPERSGATGWTPRWIARTAWFVAFLLLALAVGHATALLVHARAGALGWSDALHLVSLAITAGLIDLQRRARAGLAAASSAAPEHQAPHLLPAFMDLPISALFDLTQTRAVSAFALISGVFMKRVRDLVRNKAHGGRRVRDEAEESPDDVYAIVESRIVKLVQHRRLSAVTQTSTTPMNDELEKLLVRVARAPTTLWFTKEHGDLPEALVLAGQAVTCYSLLRHLEKQKAQPRPELQVRLQAVWKTINEAATKLLAGNHTSDDLFGAS